MSKISDLVNQLDLAHKEALAIRDNRIERLAGQLAAAEAKIAQAPHDRYCGLVRAQQRTSYCNCWKSASPVSALDAVRADAPVDGQCDELDGAGRRCYRGKGHDQHGILHSYSVDEGPYRAAQTGATDAHQ